MTQDGGKERTAGAKLGIPGVAEATLGVEYAQKRSTLESKTLHHDILTRIEQRLASAGLVADLTAEVHKHEVSPQVIRSTIGGRPDLRAEGQAVLEDYRRIMAISEKFNEIVSFIVKSAKEGVKKSAEFGQLQQMVVAARDAAKALPDRNQRAIQTAKIKELNMASRS